FEAFARALDGPIDVLINNAGVAATDASLPSMTAESWERVFQTNVFGQALLVRALLPLLRRGKRKTIANVSSSLGSLAVTTGRSACAYCCSKSALNMLTVLMHKELEGAGFTVISLDPGWNRTDMGGEQAPLDPRDTVKGMVALLGGLKAADSGKFLGYDGHIRPW